MFSVLHVAGEGADLPQGMYEFTSVYASFRMECPLFEVPRLSVRDMCGEK